MAMFQPINQHTEIGQISQGENSPGRANTPA
jgi:hypothetical protein